MQRGWAFARLRHFSSTPANDASAGTEAKEDFLMYLDQLVTERAGLELARSETQKRNVRRPCRYVESPRRVCRGT